MAKTSTIIIDMVVSRRVGQVTFAVSWRTCCRKMNGFIRDAIFWMPYSLLKRRQPHWLTPFWVSQNKKRAKPVIPRVCFKRRIKTIPHPIKRINHLKRTKRQARQPFNRCHLVFCYVLHFKGLANQHLKMARAEGLEPTAYGFGDRRSTNWAIPV